MLLPEVLHAVLSRLPAGGQHTFDRFTHDPNVLSGRAIARFHSDAEFTMKGGVPHWFCRIFKRRQRNADTRELLRWIADPGHDPVMQARHRHSAQWSWW